MDGQRTHGTYVASAMTRRRNLQVALAEGRRGAGRPGASALRGRRAQSARRGRYGTPAEVVLRLQALKHLKDWSFEQLEWEVKGNVAYRHFCRIHAGKVPDSTTMVRHGQLLHDVLRPMFDRVVQQAREQHTTAGRRMRSWKLPSATPPTAGFAKTASACFAG
jgi:Transposase domain (DUF772)